MELPSSPSEDVSHLLVEPVSAGRKFDFDAARDYLPDLNVDWVVTVVFESPIQRDKINDVFDAAWLTANGVPTIYGFSPDDDHWTFLDATDSSNKFNSLKFAWPLWDSIQKKPKNDVAGVLEKYKGAAEMKLTALGNAKTTVDRSADDAIASVASLSDLVAECDRDVTIMLVATDRSRFSGREVWDVMLCLGLQYGDGDLFHWINDSGFGDDMFFSVETSTPPGYFIPERMASGAGDIDNLIFNFSIPRSAEPISVFDSTANAVEYAQKRLGGRIVLRSGEPFDKTLERAKVERVAKRLGEAGFRPGEMATCRVF